MSQKPVLVIGYGNPSRGDDALGPLFLHKLKEASAMNNLSDKIETMTDFQLQVEHVLDMKEKQVVIFVDASLSAIPPFEFNRINAKKDDSYTSHAMSPQALLSAYEEYFSTASPPSYLLTIRGSDFELGEGVSEYSKGYSEEALLFITHLLKDGELSAFTG